MNYSKSQVKAAGKILRGARPEASVAEYSEAIKVFDWWRECHAKPLQKATMGLRSRVVSSNCTEARVSQRLKRRRTMIDKLSREPQMQLTTMHDIGGCRAVVASIDEVIAVKKRWLATRGRVVREYDYMAQPKSSGYRGVHLIVAYDGFHIEVQLRTVLQHAWATAVELRRSGYRSRPQKWTWTGSGPSAL